MSRPVLRLFSLLFSLVAAADLGGQTKVEQPVRDLRIDPLLLVSVKEYRHILETIGPDIYPGWKWKTVPLLLYRPLVQDVLLNAPRRPGGYRRFTGHTVLPDKIIYARDDSTLMAIDGQNTSTDLDSMRVLVVSDQYSRERQQIDATARHGDLEQWLKNWNFIPSAYDELEVILHEAFHVHQDRLAPNQGANEQMAAHYPLLDPSNNALVAIETRALRDAVLATDPNQRRHRLEQFLALRALRRSALDTASLTYENLNEFKEGTARYVELRFLELGQRVQPIPEMYLHTGFTGYRGVLRQRLVRRMDDMVNVASFGDNRFGNKYGGGPMRFRLYDTGGAQALLLDDVAPSWKQKIFAPGVYLTDLLNAAIPLSPEQRANLVSQAKAEYGFDSILVNRQAFQREGQRIIQSRVDSIVNTKQTLVTINYASAGDINGMAYTPFGVTAVNDHTAIYDLVPIGVRFTNGVVLRMKSRIPLLVDRQAKTVTFAIASAAAAFEGKGTAGVNIAELTLSGSPATAITVSADKVSIQLR